MRCVTVAQTDRQTDRRPDGAASTVVLRVSCVATRLPDKSEQWRRMRRMVERARVEKQWGCDEATIRRQPNKRAVRTETRA